MLASLAQKKNCVLASLAHDLKYWMNFQHLAIAVACANDSTALKPGIQYDEKQHINVGLTEPISHAFVVENPTPNADFLKARIVTEVNVTFVTTLDNRVSMPVAISYKPRTGKTGDNLKDQFISEIQQLQTCHACINRAVGYKHILRIEQLACHLRYS